ncbi:MAG: dihydrofolate reductase [Parvibaculum sp.]|nr:dihydrofolate reductase [Parvibaculum sp.]
MHVAFVVAIADNGVIGRDNGLPWKLSGDMAFFKRITMGKPVIMGRKTWESLPRKPLPGRPNIVVTRDQSYDAPGAEVFQRVDHAVLRGEELAREMGVSEVMIIGGAQIYDALKYRATRIYLTEVHATPEGDTRLEIDRSRWCEVSRERHEAGDKDSSAYSFVVLERASSTDVMAGT